MTYNLAEAIEGLKSRISRLQKRVSAGEADLQGILDLSKVSLLRLQEKPKQPWIKRALVLSHPVEWFTCGGE